MKFISKGFIRIKICDIEKDFLDSEDFIDPYVEINIKDAKYNIGTLNFFTCVYV